MIQQTKRLQSLDIFRGMTVAAMILVNTPGDWDNIYAPLEHSAWNGCTPTDIVFPAFLFMVGVSIVYALQKKKNLKELHAKAIFHGFRRMILLILLGLFIHYFYRPDFHELRYPGVLQRIGVVYFISMLLYLKSGPRTINYIIIGSLVSYYIMMQFIPIPDGHPPNLEPSTNLAAYIDRWVFSTHHLYPYTKTWDPVGLLSTIPAIATTLLGVKTGEWIKKADTDPSIKTIYLFMAGFAWILLGLVFSLIFPLNKSLWSSSYVLYTAGICVILLTMIYWVVDVLNKGNRALWPFLVFGTNALSAYILSEILPGLINFIKIPIPAGHVAGMKWLYSRWFLELFSPKTASLLSAICFVLLIWLITYPLYKKHIIIKL